MLHDMFTEPSMEIRWRFINLFLLSITKSLWNPQTQFINQAIGPVYALERQIEITNLFRHH